MKLGIRRNHFLGLVILCLLPILISSRDINDQIQPTSESDVNWDKIKKSFSIFFDYPCPQNAEMVLGLIPFGKTSREVGDRTGTFELIRDKFAVLKTEALSGNIRAAELQFRLLGLADGADAIDILETLGLLVRVNPKVFLDLLFSYREVPYFKEGYPVVTVGPAYWDSQIAQRYEYEMRIKALESVGENKYTEISRRCIQQLKTMIFKISR